VRIGTSFSMHRASFLGLDPRTTFEEVLQLGFGLIRVSAYWDDISTSGYGDLDWLLDTAGLADQPILLTVGMKGIQWPEFYIPSSLAPQGAADRACISRDASLQDAVVEFVRETVARYKDRSNLVAWQVENEPFNRSGPHHWWIDSSLVSREIAAVRELDGRQLVVNTFAHFDLLNDWFSRPHSNLLDLTGLVPEREALGVIGSADVLGLDVYKHIGLELFGVEIVRTASADLAVSAGHWLRAATQAGKEAWIIECQAEPWEPTRNTYAAPKTLEPPEVEEIYTQLEAAGFSTILLWGCEYWHWRAGAQDTRWLDTAKRLIASAR
jgi:hypothetical protein